MSDLLNIPHFENEAEEADWWFNNQEKLEAAFARAAQEGRLKRGSGAVAAILRRRGALMLRMSEADLRIIREQARQHGQEEEAYAASLLHEALQKSA